MKIHEIYWPPFWNQLENYSYGRLQFFRWSLFRVGYHWEETTTNRIKKYFLPAKESILMALPQYRRQRSQVAVGDSRRHRSRPLQGRRTLCTGVIRHPMLPWDISIGSRKNSIPQPGLGGLITVEFAEYGVSLRTNRPDTGVR